MGVEIKPAHQRDLGGNHNPNPKPEIDELLLESIELGHLASNVATRLALTAPSNVEVYGAPQRGR